MNDNSSPQFLSSLRLSQWLRAKLLPVIVLVIVVTAQGSWQNGQPGRMTLAITCNGNGGGCG